MRNIFYHLIAKIVVKMHFLRIYLHELRKYTRGFRVKNGAQNSRVGRSNYHLTATFDRKTTRAISIGILF
jgi:hypothetical protein